MTGFILLVCRIIRLDAFGSGSADRRGGAPPLAFGLQYPPAVVLSETGLWPQSAERLDQRAIGRSMRAKDGATYLFGEICQILGCGVGVSLMKLHTREPAYEILGCLGKLLDGGS